MTGSWPTSEYSTGYSGATSTVSCPAACRLRRNVWIEVETPLMRGKYTSEIIKMRMPALVTDDGAERMAFT